VSSYAAIAREIGSPGASRAIGRANGCNRIAIVIPCHRVIRSDGALCGYGGGVERKHWLLDHEREHAGEQEPALFRIAHGASAAGAGAIRSPRAAAKTSA
jgi:O-6-methylguanine DNA methyltransferase